jgi:hypothetical protein
MKPEVRINWTSSWLSYLPVLMTLAKTVSLSQGRMETRSMTSQETPSFSWAKVATSRNTCTYNAAHNKKEKSPGKLDSVRLRTAKQSNGRDSGNISDICCLE